VGDGVLVLRLPGHRTVNDQEATFVTLVGGHPGLVGARGTAHRRHHPDPYPPGLDHPRPRRRREPGADRGGTGHRAAPAAGRGVPLSPSRNYTTAPLVIPERSPASSDRSPALCRDRLGLAGGDGRRGRASGPRSRLPRLSPPARTAPGWSGQVSAPPRVVTDTTVLKGGGRGGKTNSAGGPPRRMPQNRPPAA